jgi:oligopeptide/dipeptide ABC transporter ATP-binding protein
MEEKELDTLRGNRISMIFQDPLTSLNPSFTVGYQITESIRTHMKLSRREASARAQQVLAQAGLPDPAGMMKKYPHTLSGGMRQRVMIAMALCCDPALLIADEPTTALDVTIQAQIMQLLRELKQKMNMSLWMITHDIGLVAGMADRVAVMYAGQIIEEAPVRELFHRPVHPYTASLLATVPGIYDEEDRVLASIPGIVPEHYDTIQGCRFADRCRFCTERCNAAQNVQTVSEAHTVRCCRWNEISSTN